MTKHQLSLDYVQANPELLAGIGILVIAILGGYLFGRTVEKTLTSFGIDETMQNTEFEHGLNKFNLSTVSLFTHLSSWFIYIVGLFTAGNVAGILDRTLFWSTTLTFLPQFFTAVIALLIGIVLADRVALLIQERLQQFKLPRLVVLPNIAKYTIIYVAALVALGQIGVETTALLVLLVVYVSGLIILGGLAARRPLVAGAAGVYILLVEPYGIGDSIKIGEKEGIVQEVEVLFTYIESDGEEHIVPNNKVFDHGLTRETE